MDHQLMTTAQQSKPASSALWALGSGEALRLDIGPGPRDLHVTGGRLWLTCEGGRHAPAEDIWLVAGDTLGLESGSEWVIEAWGDTQFQLLVPPRACPVAAHRLTASFAGPSASALRWSARWVSTKGGQPALG